MRNIKVSTFMIALTLLGTAPVAKAGCCYMDSMSIVLAVQGQTTSLVTSDELTRTLLVKAIGENALSQEASASELAKRNMDYEGDQAVTAYQTAQNRRTADNNSKYTRAIRPDMEQTQEDCDKTGDAKSLGSARRDLSVASQTLEDRTIAQGLFRDPNQQILALSEASKNIKKNAQLETPDGIWSDSQVQAWNDLKILLLPEPALKRPEKLKDDTQEGMLYNIQETRSRDGYVLAARPWNKWMADRRQSIDFEPFVPLYQAFGIPQPKIYEPLYNKDGTPIIDENGNPQMKGTPVGDSGKISQEAYYKFLRAKYDSPAYFEELNELYEAGVLKEIALLLTEQNRMLLDIRENANLQSLYLSIPFAKAMGVDNAISRRNAANAHVE